MSTFDIVLTCFLALITYFTFRFLNKAEKKRISQLEAEMALYDKKLDEYKALCGRIQELDWQHLFELLKRHGERYKTDREEIQDIDWHVCPGKPGRKGGKICWLEIVDKEIRRRIEELLRNGDMKEVQNLALSRDLDQAWEAIGTTAEGVAWLEEGLHSTNARQRARCYRTLYEGE